MLWAGCRSWVCCDGMKQFVVALQSSSHVRLFVTPWTTAHQPLPSFTISQSLLKLTSIESVMPSNHLILCHPLSSCLQSFPETGSFPMSRLLASGGQSIGASASASVLPISSQGWFPLELTGLISLLSKGLWRTFSSTIVWRHPFFDFSLSLWYNTHIHWVDAIKASHPLSSPSPLDFNFPSIRVFSNESVLHLR